ncbi:hypothetical protein ACFL2V_05700 [Pseudomonadota bacterium]
MNTLRLFPSFLKADIQASTTYPGMIAIWVFELIFLPLSMLMIWNSIAKYTTSSTFNLDQITNYYLTYPFVALLTSAWHGIFTAHAIRTGQINKLLIKPHFPLLHSITNNLAEKVIKILFLFPVVIAAFRFSYPN